MLAVPGKGSLCCRRAIVLLSLHQRHPRTSYEPPTLIMHSARTIASWVEVLKPFGYSPLHQLSQGERPTTLIAVENDSHEPVVIKWLTGSAANATTTGEARLTQQMRHPFVVPVRTVHVTDESQLLVLQVAPRGDLFDYITRSANGCLSEREAKRLFSQLVVALEHIHSLGVVHKYDSQSHADTHWIGGANSPSVACAVATSSRTTCSSTPTATCSWATLVSVAASPAFAVAASTTTEVYRRVLARCTTRLPRASWGNWCTARSSTCGAPAWCCT